MWYLHDAARKIWEKRYFILTEGSLAYYTDHNRHSTTYAKGDILLVPDSTVQVLSLPDHPFCMVITTAFNSLIISVSNAEERDDWRKHIQLVITAAHRVIRGYITKKGNRTELGKSRKFFILHATMITWHQDHENTNVTLGSFALTPETLLTTHDDKCELVLCDAPSDSRYPLSPLASTIYH